MSTTDVPWYRRTPQTVLLYRTANGWRRSLYYTEPQAMVCGTMTGDQPDPTAQDMRELVRHQLQGWLGHPVHIDWDTTGDDQRCQGTVSNG